jgi:hypothetical protein
LKIGAGLVLLSKSTVSIPLEYLTISAIIPGVPPFADICAHSSNSHVPDGSEFVPGSPTGVMNSPNKTVPAPVADNVVNVDILMLRLRS